jgi:hypothetical protein
VLFVVVGVESVGCDWRRKSAKVLPAIKAKITAAMPSQPTLLACFGDGNDVGWFRIFRFSFLDIRVIGRWRISTTFKPHRCEFNCDDEINPTDAGNAN